MKKVRVIGAGFSGLATAYYLSKRGCQVEVFDRQTKPGGLVDTIKTDFGLIETAANGFMNSQLVEELFEDLGVELQGTSQVAKRRYIVTDKPRRFPLSFFEALSFGLSLVWKLLVHGKTHFKPHPQETIIQWGQRCLGYPVATKVLAPALQGIYSGDSTKLSATLIIGKFFKPKVKVSKPNIRGTVAPKGGMGELLKALASAVEKQGGQIHYGKTIEKIDETFDYVIATSAREAGLLLKEVAPRVSAELAKVDMLPLASTTIFFESNPKLLNGFGCLFSRESVFRPLGVLFNNGIFEGRSPHRSETWICGGATDRGFVEFEDAKILEIILESRQKLFGVSQVPLFYRIQRWPSAIPHYDLELEKVLEKPLALPKNVHLIGNYLGLIGLGKILEKAKELAEKMA